MPRSTAYTFLRQGKVRDVYAADDHHLLIVASDRISAFDHVLPDPVPGKGRILTSLSNFWFDKTQGLIANHIADTEPIINGWENEKAQVDSQRIVRLLNRRKRELVRRYLCYETV